MMNIHKGYIPSDILPFLAQRNVNPTYSVHGLLGAFKSENTFYHKNGKPNLQFNGVKL
jgi:hypothetical protein